MPTGSEPPIIYLVDASVAVTGAFVAARQAARLLAGEVRVVLVLPKHSSIPSTELTDFWRVEYVPMGALSKNLHAVLGYLPALIVGAWRIRRHMRRDGSTHLWLNDFYLMHGAVLRVLGFRGQCLTWVRCVPTRFAGFLARPMLALAHRSSNRMVAVSRYIAELLPATYGAMVLYDCFTGTARPPKVWQMGEEKILLYVGNYIDGKGQDVALAAFAKVASADASLRLHFYGGELGLTKNRAYRQRLEGLARQYGLAERVVFGDFLADTAPMLATAYAALNFSTSESFSMTVLEASGEGVPVIATASGGPQEIIAEGVSGYLVPVGDVEAAAARILALAQQPELAARMGKTGAQHVQQHFSPSHHRAALLRVLGVA